LKLDVVMPRKLAVDASTSATHVALFVDHSTLSVALRGRPDPVTVSGWPSVPEPETPVWGPPEVVVRTPIVLAGEKEGLTGPGSGSAVNDAGAARAWAFGASATCAGVGTGVVDDEAAPLGAMSSAGNSETAARPANALSQRVVRVVDVTVSSSARAAPGVFSTSEL
jgi:hypothetical protein